MTSSIGCAVKWTVNEKYGDRQRENYEDKQPHQSILTVKTNEMAFFLSSSGVALVLCFTVKTRLYKTFAYFKKNTMTP